MTPLASLALGLLALATGPLFHRVARSRPLALWGLDGFSYASVTGLVLLGALPGAFEMAGWPAMVAAVAGLLAPSLFERWRARLATKAHAAALLLALIGLGAHAYVDGSALAQGGLALSLAVVLHRVPVSLAIWMLLLPKGHLGLRVLALVGLGLATALGFYTSAALLDGATTWIGLLQGLVAGSLLHVVFHRHAAEPHDDAPASLRKISAGIGALIGIALVIGVQLIDTGGTHQHDHGVAWQAFLSLAAQSAPALLLAYLGAGLLDAFMPKATVSWLQRGSGLSQSLRGVGFGLPLPVCSCGVIPLYRSLVLKGAPAAAAMAFLVATPEIGIDAILLSVPLLGAELTLVRVVCAAIVAIIAGWAVGRLAKPATLAPATQDGADPVQSLTHRLGAALRSGFGEVAESTAPWILLGLAIAAIGAGLLDPQWIKRIPPNLGIVLFALAGIPTYVCATGATPLVTMFIAKGVSSGAAVAFLLTGPATNATTFGVLSDLHGPQTALTFGLTVASLAIGLGFVVQRLLPNPRVFPLGAHQHALHIPAWRWTALGLLTLVYVLAFVRQGPRSFVGRILSLDVPVDRDGAGGGGSCCHGEAEPPPSESCCQGSGDPEPPPPKPCCGGKN